MIIRFLIYFYWSMVDLPCCLSFRCTTQWFHLFIDSAPFKVDTRWWLYSSVPNLVGHLFYTRCLYLLITSPHLVPPGFPLLTGNHSLFSVSVNLFCYSPLLCFLHFTYKWYYRVFVFLCLDISLSIELSRSIHVDTSLLWLSSILYVYIHSSSSLGIPRWCQW